MFPQTIPNVDKFWCWNPSKHSTPKTSPTRRESNHSAGKIITMSWLLRISIKPFVQKNCDKSMEWFKIDHTILSKKWGKTHPQWLVTHLDGQISKLFMSHRGKTLEKPTKHFKPGSSLSFTGQAIKQLQLRLLPPFALRCGVAGRVLTLLTEVGDEAKVRGLGKFQASEVVWKPNCWMV